MSNDARKRLYVGPEASGKTTLALRDARREKHLVILDLNRQDSLARGSHVVIAYNSAVKSKRALLDALRSLDRSQKMHITWQVPESLCPSEALELVLRAINAIGGAALLIDETETFIPAKKNLTQNVMTMAKRARHKNPMPVYMTAQKPTELHHIIRNNVWEMYVFKLFEGNAIDFFTARCKLFLKPVEALNLLKSLGNYEYIFMGHNEKPKKMKKIKNT